MDLHITQGFELPLDSYGDKLIFNVDIFTVPNLLNSNWGGEYNVIDTRLLRVTGLNEAQRQYEYEVNRNVGQRRYEGPGFTTRFGVKNTF